MCPVRETIGQISKQQVIFSRVSLVHNIIRRNFLDQKHTTLISCILFALDFPHVQKNGRYGSNSVD